MKSGKSILISVCCYDNDAEVVEFAEQLAHQSIKDNLVLLVTCNKIANHQILERKLRMVFSDSYVYKPEKNLGYLHGCLFGIFQWEKDYAWAFISNTDITFCDTRYFEKMTQVSTKASNREDIWCVGSKVILSHDNSNLNPMYMERKGRIYLEMLTIIFSNPVIAYFFSFLSEIKRKIKESKTDDTAVTSQHVYSVHGCIFMLSKNCVDCIIENTDPIFMYGEEVLIAELCREKDKKVFYTVETQAIHNENQVTGKIPSKITCKWKRESLQYILKRFYS